MHTSTCSILSTKFKLSTHVQSTEHLVVEDQVPNQCIEHRTMYRRVSRGAQYSLELTRAKHVQACSQFSKFTG